ncbi:hypothetical protein [Vibrio ulleungensis]|uniref:Uncharacterized protein n=1 Tax=Vibrio ulleungensis TaxID=2807619 RepID=A0ABS2HIT0_9VIBR|nr:hypothetical protein [Vibrio ulleungensis]MBM7036561.1 hypothetical protein [Vibrio ulleungensis]
MKFVDPWGLCLPEFYLVEPVKSIVSAGSSLEFYLNGAVAQEGLFREFNNPYDGLSSPTFKTGFILGAKVTVKTPGAHLDLTTPSIKIASVLTKDETEQGIDIELSFGSVGFSVLNSGIEANGEKTTYHYHPSNPDENRVEVEDSSSAFSIGNFKSENNEWSIAVGGLLFAEVSE